MYLTLFLLVILTLQVESSLFGDDDSPDFVAAYENHFANPVIQLRSLMIVWTRWLADLMMWILLGSVWAFIRGEEYDASLNITTVWNNMVSDTKTFEKTVKVGSMGSMIIVLWQLLGNLGGPPVPVPQTLPTGRKRREVAETDEVEHVKDMFLHSIPPPIVNEISLLAIENKNITSFDGSVRSDSNSREPMQNQMNITEEYETEFHENDGNNDLQRQQLQGSRGDASTYEVTSSRVKRQSSSQSFYQDIFIPAMNQNLEPKGIGRNTMVSTVVSIAQTIFWLACALFLPQGLFSETKHATNITNYVF